MSDQPEALRLAGQFERSAESLLKLDQMIGQETRKASQYARAAAELRRQHSRIEADEALMRQALDVFEEGRDALQERANRYHDEMRGYYPDEHKAMDQDVVRADAAITALRKRLESSNGL